MVCNIPKAYNSNCTDNVAICATLVLDYTATTRDVVLRLKKMLKQSLYIIKRKADDDVDWIKLGTLI